MAKKIRRVMTLADYLVIALSPALIMILVGSLSFFLLEISYSGQYRERMLWVLGWFVFGAVLVARIAIQEGREHAALFGFVLAGATALVAMRYVDQFLVALVLLAIIWACAWKLTWDCTLIDDQQDASGEGLLQAAQRTMTSQDSLKNEHEDSLDTSSTRPHAPGIWVAYFSLMALPLFGFGQLLIPPQEVARRSYAFQLLICYVASGLGLLLATSFLGLRRYLRQRNLQMPAKMTASWLSMGCLLVIALLLVALLIPRPEGTYTVTALIERADQKLQQASRFAQFGKDRGEGPGRPIGAADPKDGKSGSAEGQQQSTSNQSPPDKNASSDSSASKQSSTAKQGESAGSQQGQSRGENAKSDRSDSGQSQAKDSQAGKDSTNASQQSNSGQQSNSSQQSKPGQKSDSSQKSNSGDSQNNQAQKSQQPPTAEQSQPQGKTTQTEPPPSSSGSTAQPSSWTRFLASIAPAFKWLVYGALLLLGVILCVVYHERILAFLAALWQSLLNLFQGEAKPASKQSPITKPQPPLRSFSSFTNPFLSDADSRMSPTALVVYTFDALNAWSRERAKERPVNQTPLEFAEMLSPIAPDLAEEIQQSTSLYTSVAYSRGTPTREAVAVLERLWTRLADTHPARPVKKTTRSKQAKKH